MIDDNEYDCFKNRTDIRLKLVELECEKLRFYSKCLLFGYLLCFILYISERILP